MRAMRAETFGGYGGLKLVELPKPVAANRRVLVRITAAGVTPLDHTILTGQFHHSKAPLVLGNEGAGVVEEGGGTDFPTGSRVMFWGTYGAFEDGAYSEWIAARKEDLCLIPDNVDDVSAAGIPVAYLTAQVALTLKAIGGNVSGIQGDIAKLADLDRFYDAVKGKGRIDIFFANAGVAEFAPLGKITEEHFDKLFNINVRGTLFTVQKALPLLNDGASIILNGSVAGVKGTPACGVYGATKAAIRSLVRTWTVELKNRCIRSNVLSPGPTETPALGQLSADALARIVSTIPMGRMGEPDEIAKAAMFLASDDSSFVTGIELFVDGGRAQI